MDRRDWLLAAGGLVTAGLGWPRSIEALGARIGTHGINAGVSLRPSQAGEPDWSALRREFLIPADRVYLNVGTLGVQPRVVVDAVLEHTQRVAMSLPLGVDWTALKHVCAALLRCDADGLVFPRNTTEAMNFIAQGLELGEADEVLTTDHEHIGGLCCWELLAARRGVGLRAAVLPQPPASEAALFDAIVAAIGPRTRVVSVSHVLFTNGVVLPVAELARECRRRGIIFVVDGAHPPGLMSVDVAAMQPDFYAASPHKWLLAPQGTGLLWMREEWRTRLWPTIASGGWNDLELGAHRFNHLGTIDESRLGGLAAAIAFFAAVGEERVYARIEELRARIVARVRELPGATLHSPAEPRAGAGLVAFTIAGEPAAAVQRRLADANVRIRVVAEDGRDWIRLSPHIYTMPDEIDAVFALLRQSGAAGRRDGGVGMAAHGQRLTRGRPGSR